MQPSMIVEAFAATGVSLELSVRATGELTDEHRALIRDNRDALLTLVASRHLSGSDYYFKLEVSGGKVYVMAKPYHLEEAVRLYPWGVLSDSKDRLITFWGEVPSEALEGMRDLVTGELLVPLKVETEQPEVIT